MENLHDELAGLEGKYLFDADYEKLISPILNCKIPLFDTESYLNFLLKKHINENPKFPLNIYSKLIEFYRKEFGEEFDEMLERWYDKLEESRLNILVKNLNDKLSPVPTSISELEVEELYCDFRGFPFIAAKLDGFYRTKLLHFAYKIRGLDEEAAKKMLNNHPNYLYPENIKEGQELEYWLENHTNRNEWSNLIEILEGVEQSQIHNSKSDKNLKNEVTEMVTGFDHKIEVGITSYSTLADLEGKFLLFEDYKRLARPLINLDVFIHDTNRYLNYLLKTHFPENPRFVTNMWQALSNVCEKELEDIKYFEEFLEPWFYSLDNKYHYEPEMDKVEKVENRQDQKPKGKPEKKVTKTVTWPELFKDPKNSPEEILSILKGEEYITATNDWLLIGREMVALFVVLRKRGYLQPKYSANYSAPKITAAFNAQFNTDFDKKNFEIGQLDLSNDYTDRFNLIPEYKPEPEI